MQTPISRFFTLGNIRAALILAGLFPLLAAGQTLDPVVVEGMAPGSLTVPDTEQARAQIQRTPGAVEVVGDTRWRATQAATLKDMLDYTPGVFVQPKWGEDSRLSIRGSGLSRYYHLRGINLYQDGVPLNEADGSSDFQWMDPSAYRYTEVYKGANGLRYGASTLGGAINFVSPTGRDAPAFQGRLDTGSFGWRRAQASSGYAGDQLDGFITGSWQRQDGWRDHSAGDAQRVSGNLGWRLSDTAETRFFLTGVRVRQEIPGSVTREQALNDPRRAAPANLLNDYQRNVDGVRLANRTTFVDGDTTYEFGGWLTRNHLHHPIYQYLDNLSNNAGLYGRLVNDSQLAGHDNRLTLGLTWSGGRMDAQNFENIGGEKGRKLSQTDDRASNLVAYAENSYDVLPGLSLIAGGQYLHATRRRVDQYNGGGPLTRDGDKSYDFFNPKLGVLWQAAEHTQVYANVSRSAEPPTFGDLSFASAGDLNRLRPQRATTAEIGTRGQSRDFDWDVSAYRAWVKDELQCLSSPFNICDRTANLDRTIHQGLEAGFAWTFLRGLLDDRKGDRLVLNAAYTFSDFRFDDDRDWGGNRIPGVPRHFLRAEVLYRHPSGFYAGPNVEWVPQAYYVDNANSVKTAAYALLGARLGWEDKRYTFYLDARNLTGRNYIASASITDRATPTMALFEPGTGRSVFGGVQMRY
jgi:iron complex outermembrane receptor protein